MMDARIPPLPPPHPCTDQSSVFGILSPPTRSTPFRFVPLGGRSANQDRQEVREDHRREVLPPPDPRFPHEQAHNRRDRHHPLEAHEEQDRGLHHPPDEAHRQGSRSQHLAEAAGGGEGASSRLRAGGKRPRAGRHPHRQGDEGPAGGHGIR
ncbi:hypothetical protein ACHAXA_011553 [Cyclostephanos tholiformis]|uniref:Uncharacterized protein n=1 Tax=Cyclostephanos tholiformis TaxID=382380 RepID=A0ABD3R4H7_9STRA